LGRSGDCHLTGMCACNMQLWGRLPTPTLCKAQQPTPLNNHLKRTWPFITSEFVLHVNPIWWIAAGRFWNRWNFRLRVSFEHQENKNTLHCPGRFFWGLAAPSPGLTDAAGMIKDGHGASREPHIACINLPSSPRVPKAVLFFRLVKSF